MTFLKKLGQVLAQGIAMAAGIWPLVAPLFGSKAAAATSTETAVINDLSQIAQIVVTAEAMIQSETGAKTGAQKLAAATPLVLQILKSSQAFDGQKIANEAAAEAAATEITSGIADFMNALSPSTIQTSGKPLPAPASVPAPAQTV